MISKLLIPLLISCIIVGCNANKNTNEIQNVTIENNVSVEEQQETMISNEEGKDEMINYQLIHITLDILKQEMSCFLAVIVW